MGASDPRTNLSPQGLKYSSSEGVKLAQKPKKTIIHYIRCICIVSRTVRTSHTSGRTPVPSTTWLARLLADANKSIATVAAVDQSGTGTKCSSICKSGRTRTTNLCMEWEQHTIFINNITMGTYHFYKQVLIMFQPG